MIQQTSLQAYEIAKPHINRNQNIILHVLQESISSLTNFELAQVLNWSINRITPHVLELRNLGLIKFVEKRPCRVTGNVACAWSNIE